MPHWSNDPPRHDEQPALPLRRTPANGCIVAFITTDDLIGCDTHFWQGKTMPCERPDCPACQKGVPFRWHGYLGCSNPVDRSAFLFEMTARAADSFKQYRSSYGSLRGAKFRASRWKSAPNARILIEIKPGDIPPESLPPAPDVVACMSIIWELPRPDVQLAGRLKDVDRITVNPGSNDRKNAP